MGDRRIRLCKACGRKFTPKNQKLGELLNQEAEETVEAGSEPNEAAETPPEGEEPREPAQALAQMFPAPDEQWTS